MKNKSMIIALIPVIASFLLSIIFYPQLPEQMASHWDTMGQVNGYMPKLLGVLLIPTISVILFLVFLLIPKVDPRGANINKFKKYFDTFITILFTILFYIQGLMVCWNIGLKFNFNIFIVPAFTAIFYYTGVMLKHAEPNWSIGIRTPWTISNTTNWKKTHQLGAILFKIAAIISLTGIFFPAYAFYVVLIPIMAVSLITVLYSFLIYKKIKKQKTSAQKN
jgi:uncharacterized membrane protein